MSQPPIVPGPYTPGPDAEQPYTTLGAPIPPARPTGRRKMWPWVVGGLAAVVLLCCGVGIIGAAVGDPQTEPAASSTSASPKRATTAPTSAAPTTTTPTPKKTTAAPKPKVTYKPLTERQWKLVAKDPDKYAGKTYIVYGVVTQFDAATGEDTFRADVGHKNMQYEFEYPTNTLLTGSVSKLEDVVEGDEFRATVRVKGSFSYDTQIGGNTTVPMLEISTIKIL